jgi:hypothetical protein
MQTKMEFFVAWSATNIRDVHTRLLSIKLVLNQERHNPKILFPNCFHFFHNTSLDNSSI